MVSKEIKVPCRLTNSQEDKVYLIMDGQYIKFMTMDDVLITKKPLLINCFNIYEEEQAAQYEANYSEEDMAQNNKNTIKK